MTEEPAGRWIWGERPGEDRSGGGWRLVRLLRRRGQRFQRCAGGAQNGGETRWTTRPACSEQSGGVHAGGEHWREWRVEHGPGPALPGTRPPTICHSLFVGFRALYRGAPRCVRCLHARPPRCSYELRVSASAFNAACGRLCVLSSPPPRWPTLSPCATLSLAHICLAICW